MQKKKEILERANNKPNYSITHDMTNIYTEAFSIFFKIGAFKGIRPAVVALIAAPTFSMAKSAKINRYTIWIPIVSALLIWLLGFSPIWIIIAAGIGGYLFGRLRFPKSNS